LINDTACAPCSGTAAIRKAPIAATPRTFVPFIRTSSAFFRMLACAVLPIFVATQANAKASEVNVN
jgi:hypothetical protein